MFKFFSRKNNEAPPMQLKPEEVGEWVRSENRDFIGGFETEIKEKYCGLEEKFSGLQKIFFQFRGAQINPEVLEKLRRAAQTNKLMIEKSMANFLDSFSVPDKDDFVTASSFSEDLAGRIAELGRKNRRGFLIVREALGDSTRDLMRSIGEMEKENLEFIEMLRDRGAKVREIEEAIKMAADLKAEIERVPELEKEIQSLENGIDFQKQRMEKANREAENFQGSREMQKLRETQKDLEELEKKKKSVDERILKEMSGFDKALRKIGHDSGKSKIINDYLENPLEALGGAEGLKKFKALMPLIKESLGKKELKLSEKVREKALHGLERVESGVLEWALKERKDLDSKLSDCRKKMEKNSAVLGKKEKEREAEDWNQTIAKTKKRITDLRKERSGSDRKIEDMRKELEKKLAGISGKEIEVLLGSENQTEQV